MTIYAKPNTAPPAIANSAGELAVDRVVFDFADPRIRPAALAAGDKIQIGTVPANHVLLPNLCLLQIPQIDSNGAPTGDYSIGTAASGAALKASAPSETAVTLSGEDFVLTSGPVGDVAADTPIYLVIINPSATVPSVGKVIFDLVYRRWRDGIDG